MEKTKEIIAYIINFFQQNDITKHLGKVKLVKKQRLLQLLKSQVKRCLI